MGPGRPSHGYILENGCALIGATQADVAKSGLPQKPMMRIKIATVKVGSMNGRTSEVVDMVQGRCLDFLCLQEIR